MRRQATEIFIFPRMRVVIVLHMTFLHPIRNPYLAEEFCKPIDPPQQSGHHVPRTRNTFRLGFFVSLRMVYISILYVHIPQRTMNGTYIDHESSADDLSCVPIYAPLVPSALSLLRFTWHFSSPLVSVVGGVDAESIRPPGGKTSTCRLIRPTDKRNLDRQEKVRFNAAHTAPNPSMPRVPNMVQ